MCVCVCVCVCLCVCVFVIVCVCVCVCVWVWVCVCICSSIQSYVLVPPTRWWCKIVSTHIHTTYEYNIVSPKTIYPLHTYNIHYVHTLLYYVVVGGLLFTLNFKLKATQTLITHNNATTNCTRQT